MPIWLGLPVKKCRTDEPLSPPNIVLAKNQVSPTNSTTATPRSGPVTEVHIPQSTSVGQQFEMNSIIIIVDYQPANLMINSYAGLQI